MSRRHRQLRLLAASRRTARVRADRGQLRDEQQRQRRDKLAARRAVVSRYRRVGTRRGQRRRFAGRILFETRFEALEASTGTLEAVYPFQIASRAARTVNQGPVIGPSATGGMFTFDPWVLYRQGRLSNPNMLILGDVGSGKSSLVKTLVWRGLEFGRGALIVDPKGEYAPLANAAGVQPIVVRPGGPVVLNPLDPGTAAGELTPAELFHRNLATVRALLEATLDRPCRQLELVLLSTVLARICSVEVSGLTQPGVDRHGQTATLPMLAEALIDPPAEVAQRANMDPGQVVDESREMALAFARLVDPQGDLGGMFAGTTTLDVDPAAALTVVDIQHISRNNRALLPLVMICTAAWLQLATEASARGRFQVNDEAWAMLADQAAARWMQSNQKLARALSLSVVNVMHRLSDTAAAGDAGSSTRALAEGVIADSGTWVLYRQKPGEQPLLRRTLQLNHLQAQLTTRIGRGRGLWIVGGEHRNIALVDHVISPIETRLVDTDQAFRAVADRGQAAGNVAPEP